MQTIINQITEYAKHNNIKDATLKTIWDTPDTLIALITPPSTTNTDTNGKVADHNIKLVFGRSHETFTPWSNQLDGWVTEPRDNVILFTKRGSFNGTQPSFDNHHRIHGILNDIYKDSETAIIVSHNTQQRVLTQIQRIQPIMQYTHIVLPCEVREDTVNASGVTMRRAKYAITEGDPVSYNGFELGRRINNGTQTIIALNVDLGLLDTSANLLTLDHSMVSDQQRAMLAGLISGSWQTSLAVDAPPIVYTEEEIRDARLKQTILAMVKDHARDNDRVISETTDEIRGLEATISSAMRTISNKTSERVRLLRKLDDIKKGLDTTHITGVISDMQRIANDAPVKDIILTRDDDDSVVFDIKMHPAILDTGDEGMEALDSNRIILNNLRCKVTLIQGGDPSECVEWVHSSSGTRCHPHSYDDGHACWGTAGTEISRCIGEGNWHDMMQWVYAWASQYKEGEDVLTKLEDGEFEAYEEDAPVGWVLPDTRVQRDLTELIGATV